MPLQEALNLPAPLYFRICRHLLKYPPGDWNMQHIAADGIVQNAALHGRKIKKSQIAPWLTYKKPKKADVEKSVDAAKGQVLEAIANG